MLHIVRCPIAFAPSVLCKNGTHSLFPAPVGLRYFQVILRVNAGNVKGKPDDHHPGK